MKFYEKIPPPGLRIIKTALAVMVVLLLYEIIGRDGTILAALAAVVCMQDSVDHSIKGGVNRLIGTALGGAFSILFTHLPMQNIVWVWAPAVAGGLVLLLYLCKLVGKPESMVISSVVYLIVVVDVHRAGAINPLMYSLNRVLDTAIGVAIAVLVNLLVFRPKAPPKNDGNSKGGPAGY